MTDIKKGDLVRASKGEMVIQGRAFGDCDQPDKLRMEIGWASPMLDWLETHRFTLEVLSDDNDPVKADAWDEGKRDADREWEMCWDLVTPDEDRFTAVNPYRKPTT